MKKRRRRSWLAILVLMQVSATFAVAADKASTEATANPRKLRIVVFGAHPDDPESGTGGLILQLTKAGHEVHVGYAVTYRQGRKYFDRPELEVRHAEAEAACKILGAAPHFFDYSAEQLFVDTATLQRISTWLDEIKPDIVLTHWPLDTHPDHVAIGTIVWRCYRQEGGWSLYYFEVNAGHQTMAFHPTLYLDVEAERDTKKQALFCHTSQNPTIIWDNDHEPMHIRRGKECGVKYAEAFTLVAAKPGCALLPLNLIPAK